MAKCSQLTSLPFKGLKRRSSISTEHRQKRLFSKFTLADKHFNSRFTSPSLYMAMSACVKETQISTAVWAPVAGKGLFVPGGKCRERRHR